MKRVRVPLAEGFEEIAALIGREAVEEVNRSIFARL
jgi:hypothetical protein